MLDTNVELSWGTFWQIVGITVYSLQTKTVPWEEHLAPLRQSLLVLSQVNFLCKISCRTCSISLLLVFDLL